MFDDVTDRIALITGAASGIGLGIAEVFAAAGMKVIVADINGEAARDAAAKLVADGAHAQSLVLNVADRASWDAAAVDAEALWGPIDILCNNAGVAPMFKPVLEQPIDEWRWMLDINLLGVVHGVQCFGPRLRAKGGGHIVNTASMGGVVAGRLLGDYCAAKHAVVGLSEALREELSRDNIGVSVLCPGSVRSSLGETTARQRPSRATSLEARRRLIGEHAARRIEPAEVGQLVLRGVRQNLPFIFTHAEARLRLEERLADMVRGLPEG